MIGNNVPTLPCVNLITADHDVQTIDCAGRQKEIVIKVFIFIRSEAVVLPRVILEERSVLGAKLLLTKSTIAFGIYTGLSAQHKADRRKDINYSASYDRWFH